MMLFTRTQSLTDELIIVSKMMSLHFHAIFSVINRSAIKLR